MRGIPQEFIDLARFIPQKYSGEVSEEALIRTAINRTYYGVFLFARERLGVKDWRGSVHQAVIDCLKDADLLAGQNFDSLSRLRKAADYVLTRALRHRDLKRARGLARRVMGALNRLRIGGKRHKRDNRH